MNRLQKYINELEEIYSESIEVMKSTYNESNLSLVPEALREFYKLLNF